MSFDTPLPPYNSSDPHATFLSSSCLDLLLIELVPLATRLAHELSVRVPANNNHYYRHGNSSGSNNSASGTNSRIKKDGGGGIGPTVSIGIGGTGGGGGGKDNTNNDENDNSKSINNSDEDKDKTGDERERREKERQRQEMVMAFEPLDEEEEREAVFYRLEMLGYRVGIGLVERFSRDKARMNDTLDVIKFVCKDLWTIVFRKQIDNLKTNHRGVYVLTDTTFRPFSRMSAEAGGAAVLRAQPFLWFPCGIIRGALANMGVNASVQAETTELPAAVFKIETLNKPI